MVLGESEYFHPVFRDKLGMNVHQPVILRRATHSHVITKWMCKFILPATRRFREDVILWIPPDDPDDPLMSIDCSSKADDSGIFWDRRSCNQNSPDWIKQFDWIRRRLPAVDVEDRHPTSYADDENRSKCQKLEHDEF